MSGILDFLGSIIDFVVNLISSIIWFVTNLPSMLGILTECVAYAPTFLTAFLSLSIAATALFAIIRLL